MTFEFGVDAILITAPHRVLTAFCLALQDLLVFKNFLVSSHVAVLLTFSRGLCLGAFQSDVACDAFSTTKGVNLL